MQTQNGMLARTIHEDQAREYARPAWIHAAEVRRSRPHRDSIVRGLLRAVAGRVASRTAATAGDSCTTADGRLGHQVARTDG